jgi:hypothetical protein
VIEVFQHVRTYRRALAPPKSETVVPSREKQKRVPVDHFLAIAEKGSQEVRKDSGFVSSPHRKGPKLYTRLRSTARRASGKDWSVKKTTELKVGLDSELVELVLVLLLLLLSWSSSSSSTWSSSLSSLLLQEQEQRGQGGRDVAEVSPTSGSLPESASASEPESASAAVAAEL